MFARVNTINRQQSPTAPRLFPKAVVAVTAASDNAPVQADVGKTITQAEASGQRNSWAEETPSSVLLLPFGQCTGAVADVMDVTYDPKVGGRDAYILLTVLSFPSSDVCVLWYTVPCTPGRAQ